MSRRQIFCAIGVLVLFFVARWMTNGFESAPASDPCAVTNAYASAHPDVVQACFASHGIPTNDRDAQELAKLLHP